MPHIESTRHSEADSVERILRTAETIMKDQQREEEEPLPEEGNEARPRADEETRVRFGLD